MSENAKDYKAVEAVLGDNEAGCVPSARVVRKAREALGTIRQNREWEVLRARNAGRSEGATRVATLARLLRKTWEALPGILTEDCLLETDVKALAKLSDPVGEALGLPKLVVGPVYELAIPSSVKAKRKPKKGGAP